MAERRQSWTWQSYLTLDTLISLLDLPLPVAVSLPLLSLAQSPSYESPTLPYTTAVALFFVFLNVSRMLNSWAAYGPPRKLDWSEEVVVITGGASGLGRSIAQIYGMRGASVAILDIRAPEGGAESIGEGVKWYECDVGSCDSVQQVKTLIEKDLGLPTILINNAGIVNGRPLLALSPAAIERNFRINLISHYYTIQAFLPGMLARPMGGTIVTVSSVLGNLGASHLSDYAAAKAGLTAMHASLRSELSSMACLPDAQPGVKNIRTVLVKPGQLSTQMFDSIRTPNNFFGPIVEGVDLAKAIARVVDSGNSGVIALPLYAGYIEWMGILPYGLQKIARWASGVDLAMEGFSVSR